MIPQSFIGSSVTEDSENFVEEVQKVLEIYVADAERVELAAYQSKNVHIIWFDQLKKNIAEGAPLESMSVHEYSLNFTQLYQYALEMVADMRSRMSMFIVGLSRLSSKEGKEAMLIGGMDIARLMIHVQHVEEDKLRDREKFRNKKAKTSMNESGQQKSNVNLSYFQ
uniref:Retrotransposon gag protein n=1 Tax=Solanum tuberosum TaxID=4113 RepID=M1DYW8_SOLTU